MSESVFYNIYSAGQLFYTLEEEDKLIKHFIVKLKGGSKGDEAESDSTGVVHHDGSIIEFFKTESEEGHILFF